MATAIIRNLIYFIIFPLFNSGVVAVAAVTALVGEAVVDTAPTGTTQAGVVDVTKKKKNEYLFSIVDFVKFGLLSYSLF